MGTGGSLTRAMVAVAILRPSQPLSAPHAPASSVVSRDRAANRATLAIKPLPTTTTRDAEGEERASGAGQIRVRSRDWRTRARIWGDPGLRTKVGWSRLVGLCAPGDLYPQDLQRSSARTFASSPAGVVLYFSTDRLRRVCSLLPRRREELPSQAEGVCVDC